MFQYILALVLVVFAFVYIQLKPPKEIEHLPSISSISMIINTFLGKPFKLIDLDEMNTLFQGQPFVRVYLGKWYIMAKDPTILKTILMDPETYIKEEQAVAINAFNLSNQNIAETDGAAWKLHRRVINPAFKRGWDINIFNKVGTKMINKLKLDPKMDLLKLLKTATLDNLGLSIFNVDFDTTTNENNEMGLIYNHLIEEMVNKLYLMFPFLNNLPIPSRLKIKHNAKKFRGLIKQIIDKERQKINDKGIDNITPNLLTLLIQSSDSENNHGSNGLSDDEIINNATVFFIAGHDTTAHTISCTLYYLSKYPDIQQKVRQEIKQVLGNKVIKPCSELNIEMEDLNKMIYLEAVITESMRILPAATFVTRKPSKDVVLENQTIYKGQPLLLNLSLMMKDENIFKDVNKFNPDRFIIYNEDKTMSLNKKLSKDVVGFGFGPRMCIGNQFSLLEQRVFIIQLLLNFNIKLPPNSPHFHYPKLPTFGISSPVNLKLDFIPI